MINRSAVQTVLWWCYALVVVGLSLLHLWEKVASETGGLSSRYSPLLGAVVWAAICMFACYRRRLLYRIVWLVLFWSIVLAYVAGMVLLTLIAVVKGWAVVNVWGALAIALGFLLVPGCIQWYRYLYRMPEIWNRRAQ